MKTLRYFSLSLLLSCGVVFGVGNPIFAAVDGDAAAAATAKDSTNDATALIDAVNLLPDKYRPDAVKALSVAEKNQNEMINAIRRVPAEHREAMALLISHMPAEDLTSL